VQAAKAIKPWHGRSMAIAEPLDVLIVTFEMAE
jgi:hypothetical protein